MRHTDIGLALLVCAIWGCSAVVSKIVVTDIPPLFAAALRFLLTAIIGLPWLRISRSHLPALFALSLILGVFHFSFMLVALTRVDSSTAVILQQLQVPFGVLIGWLAFGDIPGAWRIAGTLLALGGVVVLSLPSGQPVPNGDGVLLMIAAAFACAVSNFQLKSLRAISGISAMSWVAAFAAPQLLLVSMLVEDRQLAALGNAGPQAIIGLVFLAVATTLVGYGVWYGLLRRNLLSVLLRFTLTIPLFGVIASSFVLGEELGASLLAGGLLIAIGVGFVVLAPMSSRTVEGRPQ